MRHLITLLFLATPIAVSANVVETAIDTHILPRFAQLSDTSDTLASAAMDDCTITNPQLRTTYGQAFDAWISASHLRFGPSETDGRAFALAFWPDARGKTPKALSALIATRDPIAQSADAYDEVSISARGFYALEYLLFDDNVTKDADPEYLCTLVQTITADIAQTAHDIEQDWRDNYIDVLTSAGPGNLRYQSSDEATQEVYKALLTGLQFTADTRLGRPLGSFDRPRPKRAEARRSMRSLHHVMLSLQSLRALTAILATDAPHIANNLDVFYATALDVAQTLDEPVFAGVADPSARLKIEILQQAIQRIHEETTLQLGPVLGVAVGFNALDGD